MTTTSPAFVNDTYDGRSLVHEHPLSLLTSFIVAGFHSTVSGMGTLLYYIGKDPALRDRLNEEPRQVNGAVEEAIRIVRSLQLSRRSTTEDTNLGGVDIPGRVQRRPLLRRGRARRAHRA